MMVIYLAPLELSKRKNIDYKPFWNWKIIDKFFKTFLRGNSVQRVAWHNPFPLKTYALVSKHKKYLKSPKTKKKNERKTSLGVTLFMQTYLMLRVTFINMSQWLPIKYSVFEVNQIWHQQRPFKRCFVFSVIWLFKSWMLLQCHLTNHEQVHVY